MKTFRIPEKLVREVVVALSKDHEPLAKRVLAFMPKKEQKASAWAKRKVEKRAKKKDELAEIRMEVWARSDGRCESCRQPFRTYGYGAGELDHFFGGSGRRLEKQSVFNCWRLCRPCHQQKTENRPSRWWWVKQFQSHCQIFMRGATLSDIADGYLAAMSEAESLLPVAK